MHEGNQREAIRVADPLWMRRPERLGLRPSGCRPAADSAAFARSTGAMAGLSEARAPAPPLRAPASPDTKLLIASEDRPSGRVRPIVWLGLAGWAVCCAMLFISLVQREPMRVQQTVADAASSLPAIVSAALVTARDTFGETGETDASAARRGSLPTADRDPGQPN